MVTGTGPEVRTLTAGIGFTEGPVWTSSERLIVTSVSRGTLHEVFLDGRPSRRVAEPGGGGNGLAQDQNGTIWIAQNGAAHVPSHSSRPVVPSLQRWAEGAEADDVDDVVTTGLVAPNDCVAAQDGRIWFTDPAGSPEADDDRLGRVCAFDATTGTVEVVIGDAQYPNGLAFGADPDDFFLVETRRDRLVHYRRTAEGWSYRGVFAETTNGPPDGICVDEQGNVYAATTDGQLIEVFDPGGRLVESIDLGGSAWPTNCCFAGTDLQTLVVTAAKGGRVLALDRPVAGLAVPQSAPPR